MVTPKLGINSIAELIARAKAKPDELNYASPGAGTTPHLSGELLKIVGGVEITHVPFSGAAPAIQALLAGTTQMAVSALPPALPFIQSGELKVLAVTGEHRWIDLPDVPTMVELGTRISSPKPSSSFWRRRKRRPTSWRDCRRNRSRC